MTGSKKRSRPASALPKPASSRGPLGVRPKVILDSMTDGVVTLNTAGVIRGWSDAAERMFGWTAAEVVGKGWSDTLVPARDREFNASGFFSQLLSNKTPGAVPGRWEFSVVCKSGGEIPVEVSVTSVRLGGLTLFCLFLRDITERQRAEQARVMFEALVRSSSDAIITKTLDGVITSWNPGAERIYGYTAEEAVGSSIHLLLPRGREAEEQGVLDRARRGEYVDAYETDRLRKNGTHITVSNAVSPIRSADGKVVAVSAISRDVSARKRAEAERDLFFSLSLDLLCLADFDGYFIRLSPSWERVLGHTLARGADHRVRESVPAQGWRLPVAVLDRSLGAGSPDRAGDSAGRHGPAQTRRGFSTGAENGGRGVPCGRRGA